jgi:hypothetical protein
LSLIHVLNHLLLVQFTKAEKVVMLMIEVIYHRLRHDILFDYIPKFDKCGRCYAHGRRPVLSVLHCWVEGMDKLSFLP